MILTGKVVAHIALFLMVQEMTITMLPGPYLRTDPSGMKMYDSKLLLKKEDAPDILAKLEACLLNNLGDAADCYNRVVPKDTPDSYRQWFWMVWSGTLGSFEKEWKDEFK